MFTRWKKKYQELKAVYHSLLFKNAELEEEVHSLKEQLKEQGSQSVSSHTIPRTVFNRVKDKCPNTMVGSESNPTDAAFKLGVAHALGVVDREIVV